MILKCPVLIIVLALLANPAFAVQEKKQETQKNTNLPQESDQQIGDFSLSGYGEKGKKNWDLAGKSADIFTEIVKLKEVTGNLYGKDEDIKLTADRGDFNKVDGKVHLEQNVVITTSSGTKLTTDSLDWDRKNQLVTTNDAVNIQRGNMVIVANGAKGEPNLKKVALEKNVKLDINPENPIKNTKATEEASKASFVANQDKAEGQTVKEKIVITCDGPLEIDYEKNIATFNNNVKVERTDSTIYSDKMDVYFIAADKQEKPEDAKQTSATQQLMGSKIDKIIARGNVKVVRGENLSYSEEAVYTAADKKLVLNGRPKLILYSTEGLIKDASFGN